MDDLTAPCSLILAVLSDLLSIRNPRFPEIGVTIPIPIFSVNELLDIITAATDHFASQPTLLQLSSPIHIIGDIHGNLIDLLRVLSVGGLPPSSHYLFLGDYVDRGDYSATVIALLYALTVKYPRHVFLLRGNHEVEKVNQIYGLKEELSRCYGHEGGGIFTALNHSFDHLPIAAVLDDQILCVHGGISPQLANLAQISGLQRPISRLNPQWLMDLLWSDPCPSTLKFAPNPRGNGVLFGEAAVAEFCAAVNVRLVIRAHQCVQAGVESFASGTLITVFSSSNYESEIENACGIVIIEADGNVRLESLTPIQRIRVFSALLDVRYGVMTHVNRSESQGKLRCLNIRPPMRSLAFIPRSRTASTCLLPKLALI
jgi:diadenosine tetraphosphatase ApaH/serine/threonine PP2A family protein phosphatase